MKCSAAAILLLSICSNTSAQTRRLRRERLYKSTTTNSRTLQWDPSEPDWSTVAANPFDASATTDMISITSMSMSLPTTPPATFIQDNPFDNNISDTMDLSTREPETVAPTPDPFGGLLIPDTVFSLSMSMPEIIVTDSPTLRPSYPPVGLPTTSPAVPVLSTFAPVSSAPVMAPVAMVVSTPQPTNRFVITPQPTEMSMPLTTIPSVEEIFTDDVMFGDMCMSLDMSSSMATSSDPTTPRYVLGDLSLGCRYVWIP